MPELKTIWYATVPAVALLAIPLFAVLLIAPAFAQASPGYGEASGQFDNRPIQLAQANLPPIGGIDDYIHQGGDGPAGAPSSPKYSSLSLPPGYAPQSLPPPKWNNSYDSDPDAQRNLLIGAAVVGAIVVGMWAYQQHELHQADRRARRRYYGRRYGFNE